AMAAILGGDDAQIARVCDEVCGGEVVAPANYNSPGQLVIAGHAAAVDRATAKLSELGVRKAVKLAVSVPSHTILMRDAAQRLGERMAQIEWKVPQIPVVQNADARAHSSVEYVRAALERQLYMPVRWSECVQRLAANGATKLFECGPGKVLAGLTKRIDRALEARALGSEPELQAALQESRG
ncbi:MAG TPA: ACP S-malonyltransferase, partial [Rhodanobacteraceae bacterium]|nr:ACP S-malonyltransferase [Rhodanobacteraceae bacterium]